MGGGIRWIMLVMRVEDRPRKGIKRGDWIYEHEKSKLVKRSEYPKRIKPRNGTNNGTKKRRSVRS